MVYFCIYYTLYIRIYAIGNLIILRENETITGLWGFGVSNSRVDGDFLGWNYDVYQACSRVAHISKELLNWGDTYVIDIADPQDELMSLMLVIAIDAANCSNGQ
jgi:uncharacterized protein YxjI